MNAFVVRTIRIPSLLLAAALQLLPIARVALPATQSAANVVVILFRWCACAAAALGGVQAVSGGSTVITCPKQLQATNGVPFSRRLTTAPHLSTFWVGNGLPPGIDLSGKGSLWYLAGTPIAAGTYSIRLTAKETAGSTGSRTVSTTVTMTVISVEPQAPAITSQPVSDSVSPGENVTLTVAATGFPPPSYQWQKDGAALPGETNTALHLTSVISSDAGAYVVVVSNSVAIATSSAAILSVAETDTIPAGLYAGLYFDTNNPDHRSAGSLSLKLADSGDFTAIVQNGGRKTAFRGKLASDGNSTNDVAGIGTVELHADYNTGNQIVGRVVGEGWTAPLSTRVTSVAADGRAGTYTLVMPGAENGAIAPFGDSFAAVKVLPTGNATMSGTLADGTRIRLRTTLTSAGELPVYIPLNGGNSSLIGWLRVRPSGATELNGDLTWIRSPGTSPRLYQNGFTLRSSVTGSAYSRTVGTLFGLAGGRVVLTGGDLGEPLINNVTFKTGGKVSAAGPDKLTLSVSAATGLFKGVVTPAGSKPMRIQGAVIQNQGMASGFFLGANESGHVYFGE